MLDTGEECVMVISEAYMLVAGEGPCIKEYIMVTVYFILILEPLPYFHISVLDRDAFLLL